MSLRYIRDTYFVPARRGQRVRYTPNCYYAEQKIGTIIGATGAHLRIRMDGESRAGIFHPTWRLEYLG